jgi:hypothetical protein
MKHGVISCSLLDGLVVSALAVQAKPGLLVCQRMLQLPAWMPISCAKTPTNGFPRGSAPDQVAARQGFSRPCLFIWQILRISPSELKKTAENRVFVA